MKIEIGPYIDWLGPYQLAEKIFFWVEKYDSETFDYTPAYNRVHAFGEWLAYGNAGKPKSRNFLEEDPRKKTLLYKFLIWIHDKKSRKVKIRIDNYDTWNADSTLALIILPVLKKVLEEKHSSGNVDDEDVPDYLKSSSAPPKENEYDTDNNFHKRWDYILSEMVWAFEQLQPECDNESVYFKGNSFNKEGYTSYLNRINNGTRLFGKYFRSLWT